MGITVCIASLCSYMYVWFAIGYTGGTFSESRNYNGSNIFHTQVHVAYHHIHEGTQGYTKIKYCTASNVQIRQVATTQQNVYTCSEHTL